MNLHLNNQKTSHTIELQRYKQQLRQQIRSKRKQLTPEQQTIAALSLRDKIALHPKLNSAQNLAIFLSFDHEIDTKPTIDLLWEKDKSVYLPLIHPFSAGHLVFLKYTPDTEMIINTFGIYEPKLDVRNIIPFSALDIVFTPLVAFDAQGYRLGMGGGYYDRMLIDYQSKGIYTIGIAHRCQQVKSIPIQSWDMPLNEVLTD